MLKSLRVVIDVERCCQFKEGLIPTLDISHNATIALILLSIKDFAQQSAYNPSFLA